jgi:hypothetical protein
MSIGLFVAPASAWRSPAQAPATPALPPHPSEPDWRDHAAEERWAEAVISFLRADWRKTFRLWTVINSIVAESCQQSRFDVRAATFEVLQEVMRLRRERVIFRYKRKWIAILDSGQPIIPLEDLPRRCGKLELTRPA